MAEDHDGSDIQISTTGTFLHASVGDDYFLSIRLIARDFPKYNNVIPNDLSFKILVDRDTILNSVRRIKIMSNEKSNWVKLNINSRQIELSANDPSRGNAYERISIEYEDNSVQSGESVEIALNARYLIDSLSSLEEDEVIVEFSNDKMPVCLKSNNRSDYLSIIMPIEL